MVGISGWIPRPRPWRRTYSILFILPGNSWVLTPLLFWPLSGCHVRSVPFSCSAQTFASPKLPLCFPEIAGCLGPFFASEIASDVVGCASAAELQSHRRIVAPGLTERLMHSIAVKDSRLSPGTWSISFGNHPIFCGPTPTRYLVVSKFPLIAPIRCQTHSTTRLCTSWNAPSTTQDRARFFFVQPLVGFLLTLNESSWRSSQRLCPLRTNWRNGVRRGSEFIRRSEFAACSIICRRAGMSVLPSVFGWDPGPGPDLLGRDMQSVRPRGIPDELTQW